MAILCRTCDEYDSVPGMKWGVCDRRRRETTENKAKVLITGPDKVCMCSSKARDEARKKQELLRSLFPKEAEEEMFDE